MAATAPGFLLSQFAYLTNSNEGAVLDLVTVQREAGGCLSAWQRVLD